MHLSFKLLYRTHKLMGNLLDWKNEANTEVPTGAVPQTATWGQLQTQLTQLTLLILNGIQTKPKLTKPQILKKRKDRPSDSPGTYI